MGNFATGSFLTLPRVIDNFGFSWIKPVSLIRQDIQCHELFNSKTKQFSIKRTQWRYFRAGRVRNFPAIWVSPGADILRSAHKESIKSHPRFTAALRASWLDWHWWQPRVTEPPLRFCQHSSENSSKPSWVAEWSLHQRQRSGVGLQNKEERWKV